MEFGELLFESEDDGNHCKVTIMSEDGVPYEVKQCSPEWFIGNANGVNDSVIIKYRADLNYFKGLYGTAILLYKKLLQTLPITYSQLQREVTDSLVRCCIHSNCSEEGLKWANLLVQPPYEKDHSSWDLLATCHQLCNNVKDEVICRLKCVLLSRHYPLYWIKLFHSYSKLLQNTSERDSDILRHTSELFRPYFNKRRGPSSEHCDQYQLFTTTLTTPILPTSLDTLEKVLSVASLSTLLRARQLLHYSLSHSTYTMVVERQIDQVGKLVSAFGHPDLQLLLVLHMQNPSEIEI